MAAISNYFMTLFPMEMAESRMEKIIIGRQWRMLINYAYTSDITLIEGNAKDVLSAGDSFCERCHRHIPWMSHWCFQLSGYYTYFHIGHHSQTGKCQECFIWKILDYDDLGRFWMILMESCDFWVILEVFSWFQRKMLEYGGFLMILEESSFLMISILPQLLLN